MALATLVTSLINVYILNAFGLQFLQTIVFILIIATLVQIVEIILKKISPVLYQALGIFLPLITTNCAILGIAIAVTQKPEFSILDSTIYAIATALGFLVAIVIFAGLREQLDLVKVPKAMKGVPIALITAGILAMAFMGFANLV
jgi:electron transport complex protein RnfA